MINKDSPYRTPHAKDTIGFDAVQSTLYFEPLIPILEKLQREITEQLQQQGHDSRLMWYSGINPNVSKPIGGEHTYDATRHNYFLGDFNSLRPPTDLSADPDTQDEHWVVNPLKYALEGGCLAVYDPSLIVGNHRFDGSDLTNDDNFGTYVVVGTQDDISSIEICRIDISEIMQS